MATININPLLPTNNLYKTTPTGKPTTVPATNGDDFASIFDAAKNLLIETNNQERYAQNESVKFLLGETDNAHDVMIAAQKAQIALQYTNAIRTNVVQAYQTIMQMQV